MKVILVVAALVLSLVGFVSCGMFGGSDDDLPPGVTPTPEFLSPDNKPTLVEVPRVDADGNPVRDPDTGYPIIDLIETPMPNPAIKVTKIWDDYQNNETKANHDYKGKKLIVRANIDEIDDGGKVLQWPFGQKGFRRIELDFKDDDEVLEFFRGDTVVAECEGNGLQLGYALTFKDCKLLLHRTRR